MIKKNLVLYLAVVLIIGLFSILGLSIAFIENFIDFSQVLLNVFYLTLFSVGVILLIYLLALFLIMNNVIKSNKWIYLFRLVSLTIFPILMYVGQFLKFKYIDIVNSFVTFNNELVDRINLDISKNDMLIITPHCLQLSTCKLKVTGDVSHCVKCGSCDVGELELIKDEFDIESIIATGGTLARKLIKEKKPKLIIAIACERDLFSGIIDMRKAIVYGINNYRPYGPCIDTKFDVDKLKTILRKYI